MNQATSPSRQSDEPLLEVDPGGDRLRRVVHALLAIYLLPALLLVLVVGGGLMALNLAAQGAVGLAGVVKSGLRAGAVAVAQDDRGWARGPLMNVNARSSRKARADLAEKRRV